MMRRGLVEVLQIPPPSARDSLLLSFPEPETAKSQKRRRFDLNFEHTLQNAYCVVTGVSELFQMRGGFGLL